VVLFLAYCEMSGFWVSAASASERDRFLGTALPICLVCWVLFPVNW